MTDDELQQAIAWFENRLSAAVMPGAREMFGIALSALGEKQEREKGCEICNHPAKWLAIFGEQYPYLRARTQVYTDGKVTAVICPMCGRELKPKEVQS